MKKIITLSILIGGFLTTYAQSEVDKVNATVSKSTIESQIYFLASDELKGRETGSPEIDIAASYIANTLRSYNVKPIGENGSYYQNVAMEKKKAPTALKLRLNNQSIEDLILLDGQNITYNGNAIFLNYGLEEDYKDKDVQGKVVVVKGGSEKSNDLRGSYRLSVVKKALAKGHGARGVVELVTLDDSSWASMQHYLGSDVVQLSSGKEVDNTDKFFQIWAKDTNSDKANTIVSAKALKANISIEGRKIEQFTSRNVVGVLEGSDPKLKEEYIIYSAHYDHIGVGKPNAENDSIYNGARDNAIGVVTVLSAAQNIAKYPTKRSSLFILFTGEEKGLLGSNWYVNHPVLPLNKMVFCFNSDGGGYNDTSKATIIGLNRTSAGEHIKKAATNFGLTAIDDPAPEQGLFDRSDNVHFAKKGIPAPTYCPGFTSFDAEINKYYHQAADNPDSLNYDYLVQFFQSYVLSARLIANDVKTPFWTKGDKYYDAGKKLYAK